jgi:hypothetical protein
MMSRLTSGLAILLVLAFSMPSVLLIAPPKAQAVSYPDLLDFVWDTLSYVEEALTEAAVVAQEALEYLFYVKEYILEPLAYIQSGKASQALTGGMLAFVSGQSNGTGQSQFVQNLPGHLQSVGDNASQAFLRQLQSNSNSPYAGVVASSLRANYAQESSVNGFFAANRNTLPQYSSDPQAFIRGDWSKGGLGAWFALTTQSQNNPYMFYHSAQSAHMKLVLGAQETHQRVLGWGQGFLSWCGDGAATQQMQESCNVSNNFCGAGDRAGVIDAGPVAPGAPCSQKDGTPGVIKTPGTTITSYLDKTLSLDSEKLTKMGNAATQITQLVGTLMETVQMAQIVIGGPQGGLAGVGTSVGGRPSLISQYTATTTPYGGLGQCTINKTMASSTPSNGTELLARTAPYVAAWTTIGGAANAAQTSVTTLRDTCTTNAQTIQTRINAGSSSSAYRTFVTRATELATQAQNALTNYITPAVQTAANAAATAAAAEAAVADLRAKLSDPGVGDPPVCQDYSAQASAVRTMSPTSQESVLAKQDAISSDTASTTPPGSLVLADTQKSTLVDEMKILEANAIKLLPQCALP